LEQLGLQYLFGLLLSKFFFIVCGQLGGKGGKLLEAFDDPVSLVNELVAQLVFTDATNVEALDELVQFFGS